MKKLLLKHGKMVLPILLTKYDKQCHLYVNKANLDKGAAGKSQSRESGPSASAD